MSGPNYNSSLLLISRAVRLLRLSGLCLAIGAPCVWGATLDEQARRTDTMLQRLSVSEPLKRLVAASESSSTSTTTASTAQSVAVTSSTSATVKALANAPSLKARVTTATVVLRRSRPALPTLAVTSATGASARRVPDLTGMLTTATAAVPTSASRAALPAVSALNPAWLIKPQPGVTAQAAPALPSMPSTNSGTPAVPTAGRPVRVNHADPAELRAALKLDPIRARHIIQFRATHGPFKEPDDLAQVSGVSEEMVRQWDERDLLIFD